MRVVFVNMPFAGVRAAIGPSLLKASLIAAGHDASVLYLNLRFARTMGTADYSYVADRAPTQSLAGDWVFSACLYGPRAAADTAYLDTFAERFGTYVPATGAIATLGRARELAEPFIQACADDPVWEAYDVIGFTSTFTQHAASLALARRLKERFPDKTLIFGGANCEDAMGLAVHRLFPFVDYVCSGEADVSFPRLVEALAHDGEPGAIPGVIGPQGGSTVPQLTPDRVRHLDDLPLPDYDDFFAQFPEGIDPRPGILMESSRGCWWGEKHHCTFCGLNGTAMSYRSKSADRVLDEIDAQVARYRPGSIEMVDNILDMHYFRDLLPELRRREAKLGLFYETKANLTKQQVVELHDAGVNAIQPGIESFSTEVLRIMRKGTTALQNIQVLKWCKEVGLEVYWNLLYGFPGEDPDDYAKMALTIASLTHLDPPQGLGRIRLDRFSPNFITAAELGLCNVRPDRSYGYIYDEPEADLADLAYYFEHDYVDGRSPSDYTGEVESAMRRWYERGSSGALVSVDHQGALAIWDFRAVARRRLTVLHGLDREIYLYCDSQRSQRAVEVLAEGNGSPAGTAAESLRRLTEERLMLELDGRFLSLAVATSTTDPTDRAPRDEHAFAF